MEVRLFLLEVPGSDPNREDGRQLIRASGSVGANYLEADDPLGEKDRLMRLRLCLREAREAGYWLNLLHLGSSPSRLGLVRTQLETEAAELAKIFATLIRKST